MNSSKETIKVAVIIPSRGLMFSRTADEIEKNINHVPHKLFMAHKKPIPDCFEDPTVEALKDPEITHLWYVEDDMIIKDPHLLFHMLNEYRDVVTCDYPTSKERRGAVFKDKQGELVFAGLGCTLVRRKIMDKMVRPYFRTDIIWIPSNHGSFIRLSAFKGKAKKDSYGMQDVNFYMQLHRVGATFSVFPEKLGQRKLVALGRSGTNDGAHQTEEWWDFKENWWFKYISKFKKEPAGKLKEVVFPDGKHQNVSKEYAKKLVAAGKATIPEPKALDIDYGDLYEEKEV